MKKIMCLLLATVMLVLAGCGGKEIPGGTILPEESIQDTQPTGILEPETEPTTEPATEPATEATEPAEEESNLSLGRQEGGTYVNEYAGFQCQLDTNWEFYTATELQELPEQISESTKGTELNTYLDGVEQFTDMMAENVNDMLSMNLVYQKLTLEQRLAYSVTTEEEVVDSILSQADLLIEFYEASGITVYGMEKVQVEFMGQTRFAIYSVNEIQGVPYYTLQLFDGRRGEYSLTLTLASYVEDNTLSLLELFTPVE